jgi:hypothetical protein
LFPTIWKTAEELYPLGLRKIDGTTRINTVRR